MTEAQKGEVNWIRQHTNRPEMILLVSIIDEQEAEIDRLETELGEYKKVGAAVYIPPKEKP